MALPTSGSLSILDIVGEFGGTGSLIAYYRGGAYVPDTATNAAVPTSGTIDIRDFLGASSSLVNISDHTVTRASGIGTSSRAGIQMGGDGVLRTVDSPADNTTDITGEWLLAGAPVNYQKRITVMSAPTGSGVAGASSMATPGTWLSGATTHSWWVDNSSFVQSTYVIKIEIRDVATSTIQGTAIITLQANRV